MVKPSSLKRDLKILISYCPEYAKMLREHIPDMEPIAKGIADPVKLAKLTLLADTIDPEWDTLWRHCPLKVFEDGAEAVLDLAVLINQSGMRAKKTGAIKLVEMMHMLNLTTVDFISGDIHSWSPVCITVKNFIEKISRAFEVDRPASEEYMHIQVEEFKKSMVSDPSRTIDVMAPLLFEYWLVLDHATDCWPPPLNGSFYRMYADVLRFNETVACQFLRVLPEEETGKLRKAIQDFRRSL